MIRPGFIMFLGFVLMVGNLFAVLGTGGWMGQADIDIVNYLTGVNVHTAGGVPFPSLAAGFFTVGLPRLITWDFPFLEGGFEVVRWVLSILSIGVMMAVGQMGFNFVTNLLGRR